MDSASAQQRVFTPEYWGVSSLDDLFDTEPRNSIYEPKEFGDHTKFESACLVMGGFLLGMVVENEYRAEPVTSSPIRAADGRFRQLVFVAEERISAIREPEPHDAVTSLISSTQKLWQGKDIARLPFDSYAGAWAQDVTEKNKQLQPKTQADLWDFDELLHYERSVRVGLIAPATPLPPQGGTVRKLTEHARSWINEYREFERTIVAIDRAEVASELKILWLETHPINDIRSSLSWRNRDKSEQAEEDVDTSEDSYSADSKNTFIYVFRKAVTSSTVITPNELMASFDGCRQTSVVRISGVEVVTLDGKGGKGPVPAPTVTPTPVRELIYA